MPTSVRSTTCELRCDIEGVPGQAAISIPSYIFSGSRLLVSVTARYYITVHPRVSGRILWRKVKMGCVGINNKVSLVEGPVVSSSLYECIGVGQLLSDVMGSASTDLRHSECRNLR